MKRIDTAHRSTLSEAARNSEQHVFVSYSRADKKIVEPMVKLIRATGQTVFMDIDRIPAGKRWRPIIDQSLDHADVVLVFWCQHANTSIPVQKEWRRALEIKKDIVPVLLDNTILPKELSEYQWIDFRLFVDHHPRSTSVAPDENVFAEQQGTIVHEMTASAGALLLMALRERHQGQQDALVAKCMERILTNLRELWITQSCVSEIQKRLNLILDLAWNHSSGNIFRQNTLKPHMNVREIIGQCQELLSFWKNRDRNVFSIRLVDESHALSWFLKHRLANPAYPSKPLDTSIIEHFVERVHSSYQVLETALKANDNKDFSELLKVCADFERNATAVNSALSDHIDDVLKNLVTILKHSPNDRLHWESNKLIDICDELLTISRQVLIPHKKK